MSVCSKFITVYVYQ